MNSYDKINVSLFKDGSNNNYLCSMCGQYNTLSTSVSYQGYNLICNHCLCKMARILNKSTDDLLILIQREGEYKEDIENDNVKIQ